MATTALTVAIGGGGDALASALLAHGAARPATVATWAWERLLVDPLPGPRSAADFTGLATPAPGVQVVTPTSRPLPPSASHLPRLAAELPATVVLLDPSEGCRGLARQLSDACRWLGGEHLALVDVGGDVLARPGDAGIRSPLADVATLVAAHRSGVPATLTVIGPGYDGELSSDLVARRLDETGADHGPPVSVDAARALLPLLDWHPSEATALVVATALGHRGTVEIRDRGLPVVLTEAGAIPRTAPVTAQLLPPDAWPAIADTDSLDQLEAVIADTYDVNEIAYERAKAADLAGAPASTDDPSSLIAEAIDQAHQRGADWLTRRRLQEASGVRTLPPADLARIVGRRWVPPLVAAGAA